MSAKKLISKSDSVLTNREAKVIYKIGNKTQRAHGKLTESDSYVYIELDNHQQRLIMKHSIISITFPEDVPESKKKNWTDRKPRRKNPNAFSYSKWWRHLDVKEADK